MTNKYVKELEKYDKYGLIQYAIDNGCLERRINKVEFRKRLFLGKDWENNKYYCENQMHLNENKLLNKKMLCGFSLMSPKKDDFRYIIIDTTYYDKENTKSIEQQ